MKGLIFKYLLIHLFSKKLKTRVEINRFQKKKLMHHERFLRKKSPWFAHQLAIYGNLRHLPVMDKILMMQHFDALNTVAILKKDAMALALQAEESRDFSPEIKGISVGLSSGTSGNRGLFMVSAAERAMWVAQVLAKVLNPFEKPRNLFNSLSRRKIAFFMRANNNLYQSIHSQLFDFQFFDLKDDIPAHLEKLRIYQPDILVAPPSMLLKIAESEINIMAEKIISVAEVLEKKDEAYLKNKFHQIIHQVYQCTEGFLASTCRFGTLHFHEDLLVIEKDYLDEKRFYPVITDFTRRSQPFVRYRLNDIIHERQESCPCGSPFLAIQHIEGRSDDVFELRNTQNEPVFIFPDFIRNAILAASPTIQEYMAEQTDLYTLKIYLITPFFETDCPLVLRKVKLLFEEKKIEECTVLFFPALPELKDTKLRRVKKSF